jgi:acetolactate synthase-1/2/3 large subunit
MHEGVLHATAFGRFEQPRGWRGHQREGTGMLFRLDTGEDILTGLCCPHTPRFELSHWIVCESVNSELRAFNAKGEIIKCVQLQNWVRGLAVTDQYVLVGESVNRQLTGDVRGATVAVLDRKEWTVLGRLRLPFREVYDVVLVSRELLDGIARSPNARMIARCPPQSSGIHDAR